MLDIELNFFDCICLITALAAFTWFVLWATKDKE